MAVTAAILACAVWGGKAWWADDAAVNARTIYQPLGIRASLQDGNRLEMRLVDPGWAVRRRLDNLVPDHGHLMHLFLVRWPAMDEFFHLHPDQSAPGYFGMALPSLPAGHYRIYGDIVHDSGLAETALGEVDLPDVTGAALAGDDAGGPMPGDPELHWIRDGAAITARQINLFRFQLAGREGPDELEPYMGMGGHAEFLSADGSVFAHVHPTGTVPMAAMTVASPEAMMSMHSMEIGKEVSFPYGVPKPGRYRMFVQLRRGTVRTASFDFTVSPEAGNGPV
jgi:hypothetical protein